MAIDQIICGEAAVVTWHNYCRIDVGPVSVSFYCGQRFQRALQCFDGIAGLQVDHKIIQT